MIDKKYYMLMIPTVLVVGLLVGLVFSFQPAQANSTAPGQLGSSTYNIFYLSSRFPFKMNFLNGTNAES